MSSPAQSWPALAPPVVALPAAAFEVLVYLAVVGAGALCFLFGWLSPNGAAVLTVILLSALIVLAWNRFDQGRHPCFLFLCTLMFFQGGGLLAYCLGTDMDPLRVQLMTPNAFYLSREEIGLVLLLLSLSAICVYGPCRWNYQGFGPPSDNRVKKYLPYLYLLFFTTLPVQLFKNYRYYEYIRDHGGYTFFFVNHSGLTASVPFLVRVVPLITFPALVGIFVFERRKKLLFLVTGLYFCTAAFILLLGSRAATFSLILALWYVARIKSVRKARIVRLAVVCLILLMLGDAVSKLREEEEFTTVLSPINVLAMQGVSLNVTEIAVKYRDVFSPYAGSYLWHQLQDAFVANDASNYYRGRTLSYDISLFLNPSLFSMGYGTGSSCIGEAYVVGGSAGVVCISLLIGLGLRFAHRCSRNAMSLFVVAMVLPEVLIMPRNGLLDWFSMLLRITISIGLLALGWQLYSFLSSIRQASATGDAGRLDR